MKCTSFFFRICPDSLKTKQMYLNAIKAGTVTNFSTVPIHFRNSKMYLAGVSTGILCISEVPNAVLTSQMCLVAIRLDYKNIKFVPKHLITTEIQLIMMDNEPPKTVEMCIKGIQSRKLSLKDIPEHLKTNKVCLEAVKYDETEMLNIPYNFRGEGGEFYREAVKVNGWCLLFIQRYILTLNMCFDAVQQNGRVLGSIPRDIIRFDMCLCAINNDPLAIQDVPEKFMREELCLVAVKRNGLILELIPKEFRTYKVCLEALKSNEKAVWWIPEGKYIDLSSHHPRTYNRFAHRPQSGKQPHKEILSTNTH
jgi:hypothetical protein